MTPPVRAKARTPCGGRGRVTWTWTPCGGQGRPTETDEERDACVEVGAEVTATRRKNHTKKTWNQKVDLEPMRRSQWVEHIRRANETNAGIVT